MASNDTAEQSSHQASKLVADHYNKIEEVGIEKRKESRIYFLRNFNNWIKSVIISEFLERVRSDKGRNHAINVLDIGCGKGGDLRKYRIGKISHLVCTDIAEVSLDQCKERYEEMKKNQNFGNNQLFTTEFFVADSTKDDLRSLLQNTEMKFDLVSVQFSFHYCFESLPQVRQMLKNVSDNLRNGGYFIATTIDSFEVLKRLKESGTNNFGNDVYSVTFDEQFMKSKRVPLFGAKYNFHLEGVVDCPEFLVYFPVLEDIAKEFDLKLMYRKRFEDYFKENCNKREGKMLLNRMSALETYPAFRGKTLVGNDEDYSHADDYMDSLRNHSREERIHVGTLSMSEWEAISLYIVFAFVKAV